MSCSFCYEYGHNKAGCPKRKERVARERAAGESSWLTREEDRKDRAKEYRKQYGSKRRCSWCNETGHNRRGCAGMKAAKAAFASHNSAYRQLLYEDMREQGWGVGALVEVNPEFYNHEAGKYIRQPITYLITSVNWSQLNWHNLYRGGRRDEVFRLDAVSVPSNHAKGTLWSPHPGKDGIQTVPESPYSYGDCGDEVIRLLSPVTVNAFDATAPDAGWFDGTSGLKDIFDKELTSWQAARWLDNIGELSDYKFLEKV